MNNRFSAQMHAIVDGCANGVNVFIGFVYPHLSSRQHKYLKHVCARSSKQDMTVADYAMRLAALLTAAAAAALAAS
jgi:hypothetical protein